MEYEALIGKALLANTPEARNAAMRKVTCKTAASTQMFCACSDILDQRTVYVLETLEDGRTIRACCPACKATTSPLIANDPELSGKFVWQSWNATEIVGDQK